MARGRGYGGPIIISSSGADDFYLGSASSRAGRLASYTINDQDDVRRQSRRQDKALLDSITNKLATASFTDPVPMRSSGRLRVVPYSSGGARSYVTYYVGDGSSAANISPRFQSVTPSMSVLEPRYRPRTYSFYGGAYGLGRRGRSGLDYLDLQSSYRPYPARSRRFDYLDLSLPLDIHNYLESSRYSPSVSYVPRYYRSSFDDSDIHYRPRYYPYLTDLYSTPYSSARYTPSLSYYTPSLYDYDYESYLPSPRSRALYPYNYDLQLYPELGSSAPRRRASVSYTTSSRLPLAPSRPSVSYYDDIEWPDYRPSAIRFQPLRDGSCPPALGAAPSTNLAVRNARRSLFRIERELGDFANNYGSSAGGYSGYDDYDVDYVPSRRTTVVRTGGSLPPSSSTVRRTVTTTAPKSRIREIENIERMVRNPLYGQMQRSDNHFSLTTFHETDSENSDSQMFEDDYEISFSWLTLGEMLGSGAFGQVLKGSLSKAPNALKGNLCLPMTVAVKMTKEFATEEDRRNLRGEIELMKVMGRHRNLVSIIGFCINQNNPCLIMDYCCHGDLRSYLRRMRCQNVGGSDSSSLNELSESAVGRSVASRLTMTSFSRNPNENDACPNEGVVQNQNLGITLDILLSFARQVAIGMDYLVHRKLVHRDLAARNILVCEGEVIKISDFGLTRDVYEDSAYSKKSGGKLPLKWMAPEAIFDQIYTTNSDIWSYGIVLWEIITLGGSPYPGINTNNIYWMLKSGYRMERPDGCDEHLYNIMRCCWRTNPLKRPSFTKLRAAIEEMLISCSERSGISYMDLGNSTDSCYFDHTKYYQNSNPD